MVDILLHILWLSTSKGNYKIGEEKEKDIKQTCEACLALAMILGDAIQTNSTIPTRWWAALIKVCVTMASKKPRMTITEILIKPIKAGSTILASNLQTVIYIMLT